MGFDNDKTRLAIIEWSYLEQLIDGANDV